MSIRTQNCNEAQARKRLQSAQAYQQVLERDDDG